MKVLNEKYRQYGLHCQQNYVRNDIVYLVAYLLISLITIILICKLKQSISLCSFFNVAPEIHEADEEYGDSVEDINVDYEDWFVWLPYSHVVWASDLIYYRLILLL